MIATKVGRTLVDGPDGPDVVFDFSADAVQHQLDASLERLRRDRVDIVHVHDPDDHLGAAVEGSFAALASLDAQGVVRAVSVGTTKVATALDILRRAEPDVVMIAGRLTLLDREAVGCSPNVARRARAGRRGVQQRRARPAGSGSVVRLRAPRSRTSSTGRRRSPPCAPKPACR